MKILISPSSFGEISELPLNSLREAGFSYLNNPYGRKLTEEEVIILAVDCIGIVAGVEQLTAKIWNAPKVTLHMVLK